MTAYEFETMEQKNMEEMHDLVIGISKANDIAYDLEAKLLGFSSQKSVCVLEQSLLYEMADSVGEVVDVEEWTDREYSAKKAFYIGHTCFYYLEHRGDDK